MYNENISDGFSTVIRYVVLVPSLRVITHSRSRFRWPGLKCGMMAFYVITKVARVISRFFSTAILRILFIRK